MYTLRCSGQHRARLAYGYLMNDTALHETIHTVISESEGAYVAECLEVAVATQGDSLDEILRNLREAVGLFLSDEAPASLGLVANPRLSISFETTAT